MRSITLKAIFTLLLTALMGALIYWVGTLPPIVIQTPTEPQPSTSVTTIPTQSSTAPHVHDFTYAWAWRKTRSRENRFTSRRSNRGIILNEKQTI